MEKLSVVDTFTMKTVVLCLEFVLFQFVLTKPSFYEIDDMILRPDQFNGIDGKKYRWPNNEVPYEISDEFNATIKELIRKTVKEEFGKTCVEVRPYRKVFDEYWVRVVADTSCRALVGFQRLKPQFVRLEKGCIEHDIVHEFNHAIGFEHQHCSSERDDYVTIHLENVIPGLESAFEKQNNTHNYGVEYDYLSVMHYTTYAFSKEPDILPTIITKNLEYQDKIGVTNQLSQGDIIKINRMYGCRDPKF